MKKSFSLEGDSDEVVEGLKSNLNQQISKLSPDMQQLWELLKILEDPSEGGGDMKFGSFDEELICRVCGSLPRLSNKKGRYSISCSCGKKTHVYTTLSEAVHEWLTLNKGEKDE